MARSNSRPMGATGEGKGGEPGGKIRVLLVDDHSIVRRGLAMLLAHEGDMEVCGEAESTSGALEALARGGADVAVVDLSLKESSGLDLIKDMKIRYPSVAVVVLSMREESLYAERAMRAGARGYIMKEEAAERVVEGIRAVLRGELYMSGSLAARMVRRYVGGGPEAAGPMETLTDRELEVFELIGAGRTTREIAERLHLSVKTVESHREHLKMKLGLTSGAQLQKQAIQWSQMQQK